ncbi:DUF6515 family protein [Ferruginibacter lapsinanis]|uniref:DUF6515 family protein n=1 Tax=Ferruginibacter lapsinanis TaxID=563172 RepID=UPI001E394D70|nr:DUF6515 family protein [Ferruginibacter lapsinanis]UEG50713.1 DUF6515 family protein [Ferruginibacter lapsinanis]
MKTSNLFITSAISRRYATAVTVALLSSWLFAGSAIAQRDRGRERNATVRETTPRQNQVREMPPRIRQNNDVVINRGNNNPSRDFNRGQNNVNFDRNNNRGINNTPAPERNVNRDISRDRNIDRNTDRIPQTNRPATNNNFNRPGNNNYNNRPVIGTRDRPAYRPEYRYDRRPIYSPYNPGWRYDYLPRRNSYFYSLPSTYININFGGFGYHYWDGVFYRPYNNLFIVCAPPIGIYINVLPVGYRRIYVRNYPYYYFNGTYYDQRGANYFVVSPPLGAIVESLPEGYQTVVIDGETYYTIDGAQYKPVIQQNGEIWYEVIKAN